MKNLFASIKKSIFVLFTVLTVSNSSFAQSTPEVIKNAAEITAHSLMRKVSPNTGYGAYARVKDYSINQYTNVLTIKIEAYWTAKRYLLASNYETFNIDGILTIDLDEDEVDFRSTYKNSSVQYAWSDSDVELSIRLANELLSKN